MPQPERLVLTAHQEIHPQCLPTLPPIARQNAECDGQVHAGVTRGPALGALFSRVGRQEMKSQDIDPARAQAVGRAGQVLPGRLFGQQMPKAVERAVGDVDRFVNAKRGHVGLKNRGRELAPGQFALQVVETGPVQIEARHPVPARSQRRDQSARTAGRLQQVPHGKRAILARGRLDEVGFQARLAAEGQVVVLRVVVPGCRDRSGLHVGMDVFIANDLRTVALARGLRRGR